MTDLRVVWRRDDTLGEDGETDEVLATTVEVADSTFAQGKGLMFRSTVPEDYALVMEVGNRGLIRSRPQRQFVHMLFVRVPIDVVWLVDDTVQKTARMHPWRSVGVAKANRIIELSAGAAEGIEPGDTVVVEGLDDDS